MKLLLNALINAEWSSIRCRVAFFYFLFLCSIKVAWPAFALWLTVRYVSGSSFQPRPFKKTFIFSCCPQAAILINPPVLLIVGQLSVVSVKNTLSPSYRTGPFMYRLEYLTCFFFLSFFFKHSLSELHGLHKKKKEEAILAGGPCLFAYPMGPWNLATYVFFNRLFSLSTVRFFFY